MSVVHVGKCTTAVEDRNNEEHKAWGILGLSVLSLQLSRKSKVIPKQEVRLKSKGYLGRPG